MHKIKSEIGNQKRERNESLVNCDNKTNHCNRYGVSNGLFSDQNGRSKLSNDDESSHPINASNTNNKSERKRNINMLLEEERDNRGGNVNNNRSVGCNDDDDDDDDGDCRKRMKVDSDGQDNNRSKMYQVRKKKKEIFAPSISPNPPFSICPQTNHHHMESYSFSRACALEWTKERKKCI
jgi:hypothetical protein